jgi:Zn-finger nucleic acid-binding protein
MDCPRHGCEMEHQGYFKYPRQACPECKGIFVLERDITEKSGGGGKKLEVVAEVKLDNIRDSKLACPKDGTAMKALDFCDAQIDVCAACHGLWLDRGEYEKITERMRERGDALRPNPKLPAYEAPEPSLVNVDNVLTLLGGALSWALLCVRVMGSGASEAPPARAPEIKIPDPSPFKPDCRR